MNGDRLIGAGEQTDGTILVLVARTDGSNNDFSLTRSDAQRLMCELADELARLAGELDIRQQGA